MGIQGLHKFLETNIKSEDNGITELHYNKLKDKIVAIDTSIYIYQFASAIKSSIEDLKTSDGRITTHIHGILTKTLGMLKKKIKPIFVFDGKPPNLKKNILDSRKDNKTSAKLEIKEVIKKITKIQKLLEPTPETQEEIQEHLENINQVKQYQEKLIKLQKKSVSVSYVQMEECKEIIKLLGIPIVQALEEADSQCAWLVKCGFADYVASEDMDILTFGANKLIRKLSSKDHVIEYNLDILLKKLKLTQKQFIDLCILLGCDYTPTIGKIGPKIAYEMIQLYGSIDEMIKSDPGFNQNPPKYIIPKKFNYQQAREYFENPPVNHTNKDELIWSPPNYDELKNILKTKYDYSDDNIQRIFGVLQGGYYSVICGAKTKSQYNIDKNNYIKQLRKNISFDSDSD